MWLSKYEALKNVTLRVIFPLTVIAILLACEKEVDMKPDILQPKVLQPVDANVVSEYESLSDLAEIVIALEKYKTDHQSYPLSSGAGFHWLKKGWDGYYGTQGEKNPNWIQGLVPEYLAELPVDSRPDAGPEKQYVYKSNGANYKLLVLNPDDCTALQQEFPIFVDSRLGACKAYGFWTPRAHKWY